MRARQGFTFGVAMIATACSLVYSSYDGFFQPADGGALLTDDSDAAITAIVVNAAGIFYSVGSTVKRASLDGGGASVWWTGDADIRPSGMTSDGTDTIAWVSDTTLRVADASAPNAAITLTTTMEVTATNNKGAITDLAADRSRLAWGERQTSAGCTCHVATFVPWTMSAPPTPLSVIVPAQTNPVTAKIVAVDSNGVEALVTASVGVVRFALDGGLVCNNKFAAGSGEDNLVTGVDGGPVFAVARSGGALSRISTDANGCTLQAQSAILDPVATLALTTDESGVSWIESTGKVFIASVTDTAGTLLGSISAPTALIATDATNVYVVSGGSIFSFKKTK